MYLPTHAGLNSAWSIHLGRHSGDAIDYITQKMDDILTNGRALGWTQLEYATAVKGMLSEVRSELRAGNIPLNSHSRPWATPFSS